MNVVSLFAGIGGFEVGLAEHGHRTIMSCEILPTAQAVLKARFGNEHRIEPDIRKLDDFPAGTDLVCAGFPCQDLSQAGRTRGLAGEQSGLIHKVFTLLGERGQEGKVPWVIIENVPFMLRLHGGTAVRTIIDELQSRQYRWAYRVVDTFSFGLPQRRERVFFVATTEGNPEDILLVDEAKVERPETAIGELAHGFYWTEGRAGVGWAVDAVPTLKNGSTIGIPSPPAVLLPSRRIVKPSIEDAEALQGFERGWTEPVKFAGLRDSLRWSLVGSAVSTPISEWLGYRLVQPGLYDKSRDKTFPETGTLPRAARFDGTATHGVEISQDVKGKRSKHLHQFLKSRAPLSYKATAGFYSRAKEVTTKLDFAPGFLDAVLEHKVQMERAEGIEAARLAA